MKQIKLRSNRLDTPKNIATVETELKTKLGILSVKVDPATGLCQVSYDETKTTEGKIVDDFKEIFAVGKKSAPAVKERVYYIKGMHCASCEIRIEKKLLKLPSVKSAEAMAVKGQAVVEFVGSQLSLSELNKIFHSDGYIFSEKPADAAIETGGNLSQTLIIAGMVLAALYFLNKLGLSAWANVGAQSSLPAFFFFGVLAGLSSCAALVGGLVLSMSKQWAELYQSRNTTWQKFQPHFMFNLGRLASYGILGAVLGGVGSKLQFSPSFNSLLVIVISILMFGLAMQMLGVRAFRRFQITMPKFMTRWAADESKFKGRYMPSLMGALTFFLPCGFTITAQSLALLSGSAWQGGMIMFLFALGTSPMLLAIGLSSVKFSSRPHLANKFLRVAGVLVLFFALFNVNAQLNVLGLPSFSDAFNGSRSTPVNAGSIDEKDLPPIVNGKQVVKMNASANGYSPNYFKVRVGVPVRWEITDTGTSGCTNAILSKGLFPDQISLKPGQTSIKEFTPVKAGRYKFSCWMGMINGIIEVVDGKSSSLNSNASGSNVAQAAEVPSGAKGCGCGGGGAGGSGSCHAPVVTK